MAEPAAPPKAEEAPQGACIKIDIAFPGPPPDDDFTLHVIPQRGDGCDLSLQIADLREKYDPGTVQEIRIRHVFYRLSPPLTANLLALCYELLTTEGQIVIEEPYHTWDRGRTDPLAQTLISEHTFYFFDRTWLEANNIVRDFGDHPMDFSTEQVQYIYAPEWDSRADEAREWHRLHCTNIVTHVKFSLRPRKEKAGN